MSKPKAEIQVAEEPQSGALMAIIAKAAADDTVDVDKMERLLAMQERVSAKDAERDANTALYAFQRECPQLNKTKAIAVRGQVRSKYCSYEDMMRNVRPLMEEHGFSERFDTGVDQAGRICSVTCTIAHRGGHSWDSTFPVMPDESGSKSGIQAIGSALSYGKRYSFAAAMGIVFKDEDDDGALQDELPQSAAVLPDAQPVEAEVVDENEMLVQEVEVFLQSKGYSDQQFNEGVNQITKGKVSDWRALPASRMKKFASSDNLEAIAKIVDELNA